MKFAVSSSLIVSSGAISYPASAVNFFWFFDDILLKFTIAAPRNAQNDCIHAHAGIVCLLHVPVRQCTGTPRL